MRFDDKEFVAGVRSILMRDPKSAKLQQAALVDIVDALVMATQEAHSSSSRTQAQRDMCLRANHDCVDIRNGAREIIQGLVKEASK
jgi:hypothetical protein